MWPGSELTFFPALTRARANCVETVLLPTPPFPESTKILCLMRPIRSTISAEMESASELSCTSPRQSREEYSRRAPAWLGRVLWNSSIWSDGCAGNFSLGEKRKEKRRLQIAAD